MTTTTTIIIRNSSYIVYSMSMISTYVFYWINFCIHTCFVCFLGFLSSHTCDEFMYPVLVVSSEKLRVSKRGGNVHELRGSLDRVYKFLGLCPFKRLPETTVHETRDPDDLGGRRPY